MDIVYLTYARIPTERPNGFQIAKTCEALAEAGTTVSLVIPGRNRFKDRVAPDVYGTYQVKRLFQVKHLWVPRITFLGNFGLFIQNMWFAVAGGLSVIGKTKSVIYSRQPATLIIPAMFGRKVIFESHEGRFTPAVKLILFLGARLITITRAAKDIYESKGVSKERISVVPDAVDLKMFESLPSQIDSRREFGIPVNAKIAMYTGSFGVYDWKGLDVFLEASNMVTGGVVFVAVGGTDIEVDLLSESGQYPNTLFLKKVPVRKVPALLASADILVIPNKKGNVISEFYTSPMKLFEYMASGKPIVASGVPSILEIIDETSAKIFEPNNPLSLASAIDGLIENSVLRSNLSRHSRELSLGYSWGSRARHIIETIRYFYERY